MQWNASQSQMSREHLREGKNALAMHFQSLFLALMHLQNLLPKLSWCASSQLH